jgi:hypothetical protein
MKSTDLHLDRRRWLGSVAALAAPIGLSAGAEKQTAEECALRNDNLDFRFAVSQGRVTSRRLKNRLANEVVELPDTDFALEFAGGKSVEASQFTAKVVRKEAGSVELLYSGTKEEVADLQIRIEYTLPPAKHYVRKQISVRQAAKGEPRKLMRADLEIWQGVRRDWRSAIADRMRYGSHPIYCETMWAGVEFVAAYNEYSRDGFILRSRPGGKALSGEWLKLHSTVAGVAAAGEAKDSFLGYIEDIREAPPHLAACYNTYWSLPDVFNEREVLDLVRTLVEDLYQKHGVFFDFVTADAGWSDPHSIWQVNQRDFPDNLQGVVELMKSTGGKLGLWMSPSEVYPKVIDWNWAEKSGYIPTSGSLDFPWASHGISLADPKYRNEAKAQLKRLIQQHQLGQIKYDGFICREKRPHHDLLPDEDSVEPLAEYSLELMQASREANPELCTEPTYLNSWYTYISPWMIKYGSSVFGNSGGDCPVGLGPAPDYRESQTTAREYYIFTSLEEVWLPQNALQYFDIVHCDEAGGFPNHAAMAFGRGRFFVPTYINSEFMSDADWAIYAGLLKWARRNQDVLRNTVVLPSRVELGEPYAYAHWCRKRGIVAVRNPSNVSQKYRLDLAKARAPRSLSDGVCYTQYPYRKGVQQGVTSTSAINLELAPWELVFLEIVPRAELSEPVALGARWERDANGKMMVWPEDSSKVRILLPQGSEQVVSAQPAAMEDPRGKILAQRTDLLSEPLWFRQGDKPLPSASFEVASEVTIPEGAASGKALLLIQFPGKEHLPSSCSGFVNGRAVELHGSSSRGHLDSGETTPESPWRDILPYLSQWTWYICELGSGTTRVKFSGLCPNENCRMGLWLWADWDLRAQAVAVPLECPEPAVPQNQGHVKRRSVCLLPPGMPRELPRTEGRWRAEIRA